MQRSARHATHHCRSERVGGGVQPRGVPTVRDPLPPFYSCATSETDGVSGMSGSRPPAPRGTKASGKRLWTSILAEYELEEHELALLREMVRTVDQLDDLAAIVAKDGLMAPGPGLAERVHPAVVEARQLRIALARLAAALRLPAGDEESKDAKVGTRRPQRRVGVRGPYRLRGVS
jgi:hypothetical protein